MPTAIQTTGIFKEWVEVELILVRHPESTYNAAGNRYCGRTDASISENGWTQVAALHRHFATYPLGAVWSSPLVRAHACAQAIAEDQGLSVHVTEALTEFDFGDWEGKRPSEIRAQDPALWDQWNAGHPVAYPPGGERPIEVYGRTVKAIEALIQQPTQAPIVIVSHDQVIRVLFTFFLGIPFWHFRRLGQPKNASLSQVRWDPITGTWRMLAYSQTV